jgi:SAM-dependent methyltransferase
MAVRYSFTIFLSAFLLFAVQPLIGKYILPWFGGGAGIWTACMLFFQCVLLIGYSYAHLISSRLNPRRQMLVHLCALTLSLLLLPITPDSSWKPIGAGQPTQDILLLLLVNIGLPFALLSATGPLLSGWFSRSFAGRSPWRLYALSNAGSLLALLSYPFVVEPYLALPLQTWFWSLGYGLFVLLCGFCAWQFGHRVEPAPQEITQATGEAGSSLNVPPPPGEQTSRPGHTEMLLWLVLAANASVMLLATTHQVSQDLAVIPLLWILPLALYLLSFILCFDHDWWYKRWVFGPLLAVSALAVVYVMSKDQVLSAWIQIGVYSVTLFAACMICHGELVRLRPDVRYLTRYYLVIGTGGALGGVFVAVIAPYVFNDYWEYHLGLFSTCLLAIICLYRFNKPRQGIARDTARSFAIKQESNKAKSKKRRRNQQQPQANEAASVNSESTWIWVGSLLVLLAVASGLGLDVKQDLNRGLSSRSFYGVTHILQPGNQVRIMVHGRTTHGTQLLGPGLRGIPTTYYELNSGIDIALARYRRLQPSAENNGNGSDGGSLRIGVIGLGTGTIAALTGPGDKLRYYEIDAEVERLAREYFSYIEDSEAEVEIVLGDARIVLEQEARNGQFQEFDVLVVDAFNSDAVPMHLLTREAIDLYLSHLKPDGLLVFNIANRYLDLGAVVRGLAKSADRELVRILAYGSGIFSFSSKWIVMTNNPEFLADKTIRIAATEWQDGESPALLWTDEYASLWQAVVANSNDARSKWDSTPNNGRFVLDKAHLMANTDLRQVTNISRNLYHDSGGQATIMLVTSKARPIVDGRVVSPTVFLETLYRGYGLSRRSNNANVLILVSLDDELAYIRGPNDWSRELREQVISAVSTMMRDGVAVHDFSERLVSGIESIDLLLRERL